MATCKMSSTAYSMNICLQLITVVILMSCATAVVGPCPRGYFGDDCSNHCHCLNGPNYCRSLDGRCTDGKCGFGWIQPPHCQTPCPVGYFGLDCESFCHCPHGDQCSAINGLCSSGSCAYGYGGASCQRVMPVLYNAPVVERLQDSSQLVVSWPVWVANITGNGSGPVSTYILQALTRSSDVVASVWHDLATITHHPTDGHRVTYITRTLLPNQTYKFRLRLLRQHLDKTEMSWPGPETKDWMITGCGVPTEAPSELSAFARDWTSTFIYVRWTPPSLHTVQCDGVSHYLVTVRYLDVSTCPNSVTSVTSPHTKVTLSRPLTCHWPAYVTVAVVNNESKVGPASEPVLLNPVTISTSVVRTTTQSTAAPTTTSTTTSTSTTVSTPLPTTLSTAENLTTGPDLNLDDIIEIPENMNVRNISQNTSVPKTEQPTTHNASLLITPTQSTAAVTEASELEERRVGINGSSDDNLDIWIQDESDLYFMDDSLTTFDPNNDSLLNLGVESTTATTTTSKLQATPSSRCSATDVVCVKFVCPPGSGSVRPVCEARRVADGVVPVCKQHIKGRLVVASRLEESLSVNVTTNDSISLNDKFLLITLTKLDHSNATYNIGPLNNDSVLTFNSLEGATMYTLKLTLVVNRTSPAAVTMVTCMEYLSQMSTAPSVPEMPPAPRSVKSFHNGSLLVSLELASDQDVRRKRRAFSDVQSVIMIVVETVESDDEGLLAQLVSRGAATHVDLRADPDSEILFGYEEAIKNGRNFYIAGTVDKNATYFVVGSNVVRENDMYSNPRVDASKKYRIWVVAENQLDGLHVRAFAASEVALAKSVGQDDGGLAWWAVFLIIIFVIILLALLALFLYCCCCRRQNKTEKKVSFPKTLPHKSHLTELNTISTDGHKTGNTSGMPSVNFQPSQLPPQPVPPQHVPMQSVPTQSVPTHVRELAQKYLDSRLAGSPTKRPVGYRAGVGLTPRNTGVTHGADVRSESFGEFSFADPQLVYESDPAHTPLRTNATSVDELRGYCELFLWADNMRALNEEYSRLPEGFTSAVGTATKPVNASLNRTLSSIPYDHNRVRLNDGTYVNASSVRTIGQRTFIVTQFPVAVTLTHFWHLVWEQKVSVAVALLGTEERECEVYWPNELNTVASYGDVRVEMTDVAVLAHVIIRQFIVERHGSVGQRKLFLWQYTWWSGKGGDTAIPSHPTDFVMFVKCLHEDGILLNSGGPVLVSCCTGGGRSGIFLAVDALLDQGRNTGIVDVLKCVAVLRTQRCGLVRSLRQYNFVYQCLCEEFDHPISRFPVETFLSSVDFSSIPTEYRLLVKPAYFSEARCRLLLLRRDRKKTSLAAYNCLGGHRNSPETDPSCRGNINSEMEQNGILDPDPHPVVGIDSYMRCGTFVVTQCPSPLDADGFWSIVVETSVTCIVSLSRTSDLIGSQLIFPRHARSSLSLQYHTVECMSVRADPGSVYLMLDLIVSSRHPTAGFMSSASKLPPKQSLQVRIYEFAKWPADCLAPPVYCILELVTQVRCYHLKHFGTGRPVLVFGVPDPDVGRCDRSRSAVFVALWRLVEELTIEGMIDVFAMTRITCTLLPTAIITEEQYTLLYEAIREYVTYNDRYATDDNCLGRRPSIHRTLIYNNQLPASDAPVKVESWNALRINSSSQVQRAQPPFSTANQAGSIQQVQGQVSASSAAVNQPNIHLSSGASVVENQPQPGASSSSMTPAAGSFIVMDGNQPSPNVNNIGVVRAENQPTGQLIPSAGQGQGSSLASSSFNAMVESHPMTDYIAVNNTSTVPPASGELAVRVESFMTPAWVGSSINTRVENQPLTQSQTPQAAGSITTVVENQLTTSTAAENQRRASPTSAVLSIPVMGSSPDDRRTFRIHLAMEEVLPTQDSPPSTTYHQVAAAGSQASSVTKNMQAPNGFSSEVNVRQQVENTRPTWNHPNFPPTASSNQPTGLPSSSNDVTLVGPFVSSTALATNGIQLPLPLTTSAPPLPPQSCPLFLTSSSMSIDVEPIPVAKGRGSGGSGVPTLGRPMNYSGPLTSTPMDRVVLNSATSQNAAPKVDKDVRNQEDIVWMNG